MMHQKKTETAKQNCFPSLGFGICLVKTTVKSGESG